MKANDLDINLIILYGTIVFLAFTILLIVFMIFYSKKRIAFFQEKAMLQAQFEQEIMTSQSEIREETLKSISRELHDNVVQMLSLVKLQLSQLPKEVAAIPNVSDSRTHLTSAINDLRALSKTLNTENILHEGLTPSIGFELSRIEKATGISTTLEVLGDEPGLSPDRQVLVFRIVQELLQNILKHAQATQISVQVASHREQAVIEVEDNGKGFDVENKMTQKGFENGSGLKNMVYRAKLLNGNLQFNSSNSYGTKAVLSIPVR